MTSKRKAELAFSLINSKVSHLLRPSQMASVVKNPPAKAGDAGLFPGLGSPGEGNGNPIPYSCLGNT